MHPFKSFPHRVYGCKVYLDPKSMYNHSPKPIITAIKAIILHTFGVQVGVQGLGVQGGEFRV